MEQIINILIGLIATFLLGLSIKPLLKKIKRGIVLVPPSENLKKKWKTITTQEENDKSGAILGHLERLLFFIAIWIPSYPIIGGWLAFKVASKWQVWNNIISVPKTLQNGAGKVDELDYLLSRRRWGSQRLMTFLVGTIANFLAAIGGIVVGKYGYEFIKTLVH